MTWVLIDKEKKVTSAYDFFLDPACVLCLAGSIGFVVALAGWIGALRDAIEALQIVSKCISPQNIRILLIGHWEVTHHRVFTVC